MPTPTPQIPNGLTKINETYDPQIKAIESQLAEVSKLGKSFEKLEELTRALESLEEAKRLEIAEFKKAEAARVRRENKTKKEKPQKAPEPDPASEKQKEKELDLIKEQNELLELMNSNFTQAKGKTLEIDLERKLLAKERVLNQAKNLNKERSSSKDATARSLYSKQLVDLATKAKTSGVLDKKEAIELLPMKEPKAQGKENTSFFKGIKDAVVEGSKQAYEKGGNNIVNAILGPLALIVNPLQELFGSKFFGMIKDKFKSSQSDSFIRKNYPDTYWLWKKNNKDKKEPGLFDKIGGLVGKLFPALGGLGALGSLFKGKPKLTNEGKLFARKGKEGFKNSTSGERRAAKAASREEKIASKLVKKEAFKSLSFGGKILKVAAPFLKALPFLGTALSLGVNYIEGQKNAESFRTSKSGATVGTMLASGQKGGDLASVVGGAFSGALTGGTTGAFAGPVGVAIGAGLGSVIGGIFGFIGSENLSKFLDPVLAPLDPFFQGIANWVSDYIIDPIKLGLKNVGEGIKNTWDTFASWLFDTGPVAQTFKFLFTLGAIAVDKINKKLTPVRRFFSDVSLLFGTVTKIVSSNLIKGAQEIGQKALDWVGGGVTFVGKGLGDLGVWINDNMLAPFGNLLAGVFATGSKLVEPFLKSGKKLLDDFIGNVKTTIGNLVNSFNNFFVNPVIDFFASVGETIGFILKDGIKAAIALTDKNSKEAAELQTLHQKGQLKRDEERLQASGREKDLKAYNEEVTKARQAAVKKGVPYTPEMELADRTKAMAKVTQVNDAIISPQGRIVVPSPEDTIIATKSPVAQLESRVGKRSAPGLENDAKIDIGTIAAAVKPQSNEGVIKAIRELIDTVKEKPFNNNITSIQPAPFDLGSLRTAY